MVHAADSRAGPGGCSFCLMELCFVAFVGRFSSKPERLATKLFYTTGAGWLELQPRNAEALTFDKVWGKCAAYTTGNGLDVVTVSEFLAFAGETNKHVLERVGV